MSEPTSEQSIFLQAIALASPAERAAYLDEACRDKPKMRAELDALLAAHDQLGGELPPTGADHSRSEAAASEEPPAAPSSEAAGAVIGPYKLLEQIGDGGMGTVWMAQQTEPIKRLVALKLIKAGMDSKAVLARFEAERQALALMDHPNIAKVHDAGTTQTGRPFFVMELVKGVPITRYCDEHRLTPRQRLELFVPVCHAVQHAHQKGIIHRDLKPSNVLVALYDGKPVPKVIDFGVAKAAGQPLTEKTLVTGFGAIVGTLEYMSPEQAEINQLDIDTRSDIYSFGVLLYELLTGSPPFTRKELEKAGMLEMLRVIREQEPSKPSTKLSTAEGLPTLAANRGTEPAKLTKLVRGELDWIVMKALEKDRSRRYETANGFAMDVQRYLADEAVLACPPSAGYRLRKVLRRNKGPVLAASLVLAALVIGMVGTTWGMIRATDAKADLVREAGEKTTALGEKEAALVTAKANELKANTQEAIAKKQEAIAKEKEQTAEKQELLARRRLYASQTNLAHQAWEAGNPARVLELLEGLRPKFDEDDLRSFEWYYLWRLCHAQRRLGLHGHTGPVSGVAFSPDGKTLASAGYDLTVRLWDPITGEQKTILSGNGTNWFAKVAFTPDGKTLAASRWAPGTVELWDASTGQQRATLDARITGASIRSLAISPDGKTLAGGAHRVSPAGKIVGVIKLWEIASGKELATMEGHREVILGLAFSPDGKTLASASGWGDDRGIVVLWDVSTKTARLTLQQAARDVTFSPDGELLAASHNEVMLYDVVTGTKRAAISGGLAHAVRFSPDGKTVATAGENRTVRLADVATGTGRTLGTHLGAASCVAFSPDGKILASGGADGAVNLWNTDPVPRQSVLKHSAEVRALAFAPDGKTLITGGNCPVQLWDLATEKAVALKGPAERMIGFALAPDGKSLAVSSFEKLATPNTRAVEAKSVKVWDLATGQARGTFESPGQVSGAAYSADGKTLATWKSWGPTAEDVTIRLWDVATHNVRATLQAPGAGSIICAAFSPDGKTLVAGAQFNSFVVWDLASRQKIVISVDRGHSSTHAVVFSPDGKTLATAGGRGTVRLWNVERWQLQASLKGHTDTVQALAFSPDGKTLATGSIDATVRFWDVITGQERMTLTGHTAAVTSLAFTPDGNTLASGSDDKTVRLWRAATEPDATARKTELDPDDADSPGVMNHWGDRLQQIGRPKEAENAYRKALARLEKLAAELPDHADYRQELAYSLFAAAVLPSSTDRAQTAEQAHRRVREVYQKLPPDQQRVLALRYETLGVAHYSAGDWKGAVEALHKSMELLNQAYIRDFFFLSMACWKLGAQDEARKWYTAALVMTEKRAPKNEELLRLRGEAAALLGLSEKAAELAPQALTDDLQLWTLALDADPKAAWAYRARGQTHLSRRNFDKAILDFDKVIDLTPLEPNAWYDRGLAHYRFQKYAEAVAAFLKAIEINPKFVIAHDALVATYEQDQQFAKAEPFHREALQRAQQQFGAADPRTAGQLAVLGLNLLRQRKYAEVEPFLRECLALREQAEPDAWATFNAQSMLGGCLLGQKKHAEAEPLLLRGYEGMKKREAKIPPVGKPRLPEAIERLVQLYEATNKPHESVKWQAVLEQHEGSKVGPVHDVGDGLHLHGKIDEKTTTLVYEVKLTAGKTYAIDMASPDQKALDPYLVLKSAERQRLAEDDDSGGGLNAHITYRATRDGLYRIHATSFNAGRGEFTLTVREKKGGPPEAKSK